MTKPIQVTARGSATDDDRSVGRLGDGHRSDVRMALVDALGEGAGNERPQDFRELGKPVRGLGCGDSLFGFVEQRVR